MTVSKQSTNLMRVFRTVRHLERSQIIHRGANVARRWIDPLFAPRRGTDWMALDAYAPSQAFPMAACEATARDVDLLEEGVFQHLNQAQVVGFDKPNWRLGKQTANRLWIVTLHYHQWAYELARLARRQDALGKRAERLLVHYLSHWIENCDLDNAGSRQLAWNSYAIATRITWWIGVFEILGERLLADRPELARAMLASLYKQAGHLARHLEWDLRGNHLLRDSVGLAWAGRFFQQLPAAGPAPRRWLRTASHLASKQVVEQVLGDGGHFERSPHYHVEVMRDTRSLAMLLGDQGLTTKLHKAWDAMAEYIRWMCHPDGTAVQFNDGPALRPRPAPTGRCLGGRHFADSGIVVWHGTPWSVFFDTGKIGPDFQPGHAHADTLTVECSVQGKRLFVDPGCHSYDHDQRRRYDRATSSHNTVCVDGEDSSEVWHIFRVGRRARPLDVMVCAEGSSLSALASHDGYDHLRGRPRHRRSINVADGQGWEIADTIDGLHDHTVEGGYLLAPEWDALPAPSGWSLKRGPTRVRVVVHCRSPLRLAVERCPIHPDYGVEITTNRLVWRYRGPLPLVVNMRVELV